MVYANDAMEIRVEFHTYPSLNYKEQLKDVIKCVKECEKEYNGKIRCTLSVIVNH